MPARCLDKLLPHKADFFTGLRARWQSLFAVSFEVLHYDLTSTYFESPPPAARGEPGGEESKRKFGYSRDKRPDRVQVVIALIVTPEGLPDSPELGRIGARPRPSRHQRRRRFTVRSLAPWQRPTIPRAAF